MSYIMSKAVDWSLFNYGFAIPIAMYETLTMNLSKGRLLHGETRDIKIILNGKTYDVTLTSINFNRQLHTNHQDIWQVRYKFDSDIAVQMREIFSQSLFIVNELRRQSPNARMWKIPKSQQEYLVIYSTDLKDTFYVETICRSEMQVPIEVKEEILLENLFDVPVVSEYEVAMIEKYHMNKIFKLYHSIGVYLKRLYNFKCQICGESIGENYGAKIAECHHINYFVESFNSDLDNLLIVCPNHHRIIHSMNPIFNQKKKLYIYPNGYEEGLKLNLHI